MVSRFTIHVEIFTKFYKLTCFSDAQTCFGSLAVGLGMPSIGVDFDSI